MVRDGFKVFIKSVNNNEDIVVTFLVLWELLEVNGEVLVRSVRD